MGFRTSYKFQVNGTSYLNGNATFDGDVTINGGDLTVKSTGDVTLWLQADTDNVTETDQPLLKMTQDGGSVGWNMGFINNSNSAEMVFSHSGTDYLNLKFVSTDRFRFTETGVFHADNDIIAYSSTISDVSLKENITPITNALDVITNIDTIRYKYNYRDGYHYGIKAQQLQNLIPEIVKETDLSFHTGVKDDRKLTVRDKELIPFLIESIKELKNEIDTLKGVA